MAPAAGSGVRVCVSCLLALACVHTWVRARVCVCLVNCALTTCLVKASFFVWKLLEKYEKWHHFCAHAQWWSPWRCKNVETGHLAPSNLTFLLIAIETVFAEWKRKGGSTKLCLRFFNFCLGTFDLSKFSENFTPFVRLWKTITKSLGKN